MPDRQDELADLLKRYDPARTDPPLQGEDLARMRRAVMTAAARRGTVGPPLAWRWAAALAVLFAVSAVALLPRPGTGRPPIEAVASRAGEASAVRARQVQMVTPGGTRIVWVLNPDLNL